MDPQHCKKQCWGSGSMFLGLPYPEFCFKFYYAGIISVRSTHLWEKGKDPYLWLMDPDPEPGNTKTCGSCGSGSGSPTLGISKLQLLIKKIIFFPTVFFSNFWPSKPWIRIHLKYWIRIRNTDKNQSNSCRSFWRRILVEQETLKPQRWHLSG